MSAPINAVDRPNLRRLLDKALAQPLTLIVAPAGSGKSVLLAQWASTHPELAFVWLNLTASDDDPVRFARRLLEGVGTLRPGATELAPLVSMHGGGLGTPLLEGLGPVLAELPETVLILDDLHQLSNARLIADLGRLVEELPAHVHLVLASRVDPPFAWSRLRVRRGLSEIRQAELAFDAADSAQLLTRLTARPLDPDQVAALVQRTEGWAAGLQLAAMTMRTQDSTADFIAQFSGSDRLIADYLSEEVLQAQSAARRQLLLHISAIDEMCADLVTALTGHPSAQLVLEELERESMFLVPLDGRRQWYRFHHLFRDLLRFRLRAEEPGTEGELLTAAAAWHLERDEVNLAVGYLLRARRWEEAMDLMVTRGAEVFEQIQMATMIRWISEVPETVRAGRRDISILLGLLKGAEGQAAGAEDLLRGVAADPGATPGEQACAQAFLAAMAQLRTNPVASIQAAMQALELLDGLNGRPLPNVLNLTDPQSLETMVVGSCGQAHFFAGHPVEARAWLRRGLDSPGASSSLWRIGGLGSLGLIEAWGGRLHRAQTMADESLGVARDIGILTHTITANAFLTASLTGLERGEPRRAAMALREASLRSEANRRTPLIWVCRLLLAVQQAAEGHPDLATGTLIAAASELGAPPPPVVERRILALRCRLLRLGGSPEEAWRLLWDADWDSSDLRFEGAATALTLGHPDQARKLLGGTPAEAGAGPLPTVERLVLQAWLALAEGYPEDARHPLAEAMAMAGSHELVEVFIRGGPEVVRMVADLPDGPVFRGRILARAEEVFAQATGIQLPDPLTDRELEILSYLPSRLTNTELADQCYVSVNTIKTHMAHIYRKLEVANRNEAIVKARQLGLLAT